MGAQLVEVTNKGSARIQVVSQRITEDGRERHHNGIDLVEPGKTRALLVDDDQCLRIEFAPPDEPDEPLDEIDEAAGVLSVDGGTAKAEGSAA